MKQPKPYYVFLFASRNKDNHNVNDFKQRKYSFVSNHPIEDFKSEFERFVESGKPGETSRWYVSVNSRNPEKLYKSVIHYLIDNPEVDFSQFNRILASLANKPEMSLTHRFLFDFDGDSNLIDEIKAMIVKESGPSISKGHQQSIEVFNTYHNSGFIVEHGFDTRQLLADYPDLTLKRDAMKFITAKTKSGE